MKLLYFPEYQNGEGAKKQRKIIWGKKKGKEGKDDTSAATEGVAKHL